MVEANTAALEVALHKSTLPEQPNWPMINDFIFDVEKAFLKLSL
jgi:hypothetical protein